MSFPADFLVELRHACQRFLRPWTEGASFESLSPARSKAVCAAADELVRLVRSAGFSDTGGTRAPRRAPSRKRRSVEEDLARLSPDLEEQVGVTHAQLTSLFMLDALKGFGPQKFKGLHADAVDVESVVLNPEHLTLPGKTGEQLREALAGLTDADRVVAHDRAARQLVSAADLGAQILTYAHPAYPRNVFESNNPVPVLYARGDVRALSVRTAVACVGSRNIREPYAGLQSQFAAHAASAGAVIVSGFALGADTVAHRAAVEAGGATICVMPGGLDRPFPPENKELFERLLQTPGVAFLSEFPFGTGASGMTLRRRNKLIVAAANGVLIGQSSSDGGAMNAFRFALEQRKTLATFMADDTSDTTGNRQIEAETKVPAVAFPTERAVETWDAWLSQLS
ncbi:DNA-processing protein DprA [Geodermatophilus sp. SYSU D01062]